MKWLSLPHYTPDIKCILFIVSLSIFLIPVLAHAQFSIPTVELDQKVYTWTDKVYITVVAPDQNFDSNLIDEILIDISTKNQTLNGYKLRETGADTAIFIGEITLTGFQGLDANSNGIPDDATGVGPLGNGTDDGHLPAKNTDLLIVSFEFDTDEPPATVLAEIRWNVGKVSWLEPRYPGSGMGVVRVIDPDINLNPQAVDIFDLDVWSDSDAVGIDLTVTETNEATGIFEGTVLFTSTDSSSGNRLRIAEGDTVTAEYKDRTIPFPYKPGHSLDIARSVTIGDSNVWTMEQIQGTDFTYPDDNIKISFSENMDDYFPTNKAILDRISSLNQQGVNIQFDQQGIARYDGKDFTLKKTISVLTTTREEFVAIFGNDHTIEPVQINNGKKITVIDDSYLDEKIESQFELCSRQDAYQFCNISIDDLNGLIKNKIGMHTITETMVLKKDAAITPITLISHNEQYGKKFGVFSNIAKFFYPHDSIRFVNAQSGQIQEPPIIHESVFLNGITLGYGFDNDWSYEYNVLGMIPVSVNLHIENGLGLGLRIPIKATSVVSPAGDEQNPNDVAYTVRYSIDTLDLNKEDYQKILSVGQEFDGKEFKIYLGPRIDFVIELFGDDFYERSEGLSPVTIPASDFAPPLGNREPITSYDIPCETIRTCIEYPVIQAGLKVGIEAGLTGKQIAVDSTFLSPEEKSKRLIFTDKSEQKTHESAASNVAFSGEGQEYVDYGIELGDVQYHSDLDFVPRVILLAQVDPWIFPLDLSTGWINFPKIRFNDIVLGPHDGTDEKIRMTGALMVPEFGITSIIMLVVALSSIILVTRTRCLSK